MIHSTQSHSVPRPEEAEYLDGWRRARAELDNFRKRLQGQDKQRASLAQAAALSELLPVADHFQAMIRHIPKELEKNTWAQGVLHVAREFEQVLQSQGLSVISQANVPFDPTIHEAVDQEKSADGKTSGMVLEIVQPGYKMGERVLKPARVKISS